MPDEESTFVSNEEPTLPHLGRSFELHGPSGIFKVRIDIQMLTHDGHIMIGGTVVEGSKTYPTGITREAKGELVTAFVTESQYMRLSNGPVN